jgi:exonuclease III
MIEGASARGGLRIATWNFLAGGSARRAAHWELILDRIAPDVLLSQECRPAPPGGGWADRLWVRAPGRSWGTGLYLRRGSIRPIAVPGFRGWVTGGELDRSVTARPLRVFSVHCPHGEHGYVKTMGQILDRLAQLARGADLVMGGDFNVAAGARGAAGPVRMTNGERCLLERLEGELALIPCWRTINPSIPLAQTLRWTGNRLTPYHCDGIFVPARWRARLASCEVLQGSEWERLSDHNPVVAVVSRGARGIPSRISGGKSVR